MFAIVGDVFLFAVIGNIFLSAIAYIGLLFIVPDENPSSAIFDDSFLLFIIVYVSLFHVLLLLSQPGILSRNFYNFFASMSTLFVCFGILYIKKILFDERFMT